MATKPYRRVAEFVLVGPDDDVVAECEALAVDDLWTGAERRIGHVGCLEDVSASTGSDICIVMVNVGGRGGRLHLDQMRDAIENIRFKTREAVLVFVAFGEVIADGDVARLTQAGAFDLVLQTASPHVLLATAAALARLSEMMTSGRRRSLKRGETASLRVGQWEINADTKIAQRADGSEVRLSESEIDYLKFLLNAGRNDAERAFPEVVGPPTSRQSALVYKLKAKLGRDLPIVNSGPETYRISEA